MNELLKDHFKRCFRILHIVENSTQMMYFPLHCYYTINEQVRDFA